MGNFIATLILIIITLFVVNLFPMGKSFFGSIVDSFHEKTTNVTQEIERVKGKVDEVKTTVTETKQNITNTIDSVNKAVDSASEAVDSLNKIVGKDEEGTTAGEDTTKTDVAPAPTSDAVPQK
jgi:methyl-accepting chemotaxis protein